MTLSMNSEAVTCKWICILEVFLLTSVIWGQEVKDTRLVNGNNTYGIVEVLVNGLWGTVCDDQWNDVSASVVCRSLGFWNGGEARIEAALGEGTGIIWLDDVSCKGHESTLNDCTKRLNAGSGMCKHSEDAGVVCFPNTVTLPPSIPSCNSRLIRLHAKNNVLGMGLVEVFHNDSWGYVCDDLWDKRDAEVACRMLCYPNLTENALPTCPDYAIPGDYDHKYPIIVDDMQCSGNEESLHICTHRPWYQHNCSPTEVARLSCVESTQEEAKPPNPDLVCTADYIDVKFKRSRDRFLEEKHLALARSVDPVKCEIAKSTTANIISVRIPSSQDCGTTLSGNATHICYTDIIKYDVTSLNGDKQILGSYLVTVTCCLPRNYKKVINVEGKSQNVTKEAGGLFRVDMAIYLNNAFTTPASLYPVSFYLGEFVRVALQVHSNDPRLMLLLPFCVATPTLDRHDSTRSALIDSSCAIEESLSVITLTDTKVGFRYKMFQFVNRPSVYIHCEVIVCSKTEGRCDNSCNSTKPGVFGRRRKRDLSNNMYLLDSGAMKVIRRPDGDAVIEEVESARTFSQAMQDTSRSDIDQTLESIVEVAPVETSGMSSGSIVTRKLIQIQEGQNAEETAMITIIRSKSQSNSTQSDKNEEATVIEDVSTKTNGPKPTNGNQPTETNPPKPTHQNQPTKTNQRKPANQNLPTETNQRKPTDQNQPIETNRLKPTNRNQPTVKSPFRLVAGVLGASCDIHYSVEFTFVLVVLSFIISL